MNRKHQKIYNNKKEKWKKKDKVFQTQSPSLTMEKAVSEKNIYIWILFHYLVTFA